MELYHVCFDPARDRLDFITPELHTTPLQQKSDRDLPDLGSYFFSVYVI